MLDQLPRMDYGLKKKRRRLSWEGRLVGSPETVTPPLLPCF